MIVASGVVMPGVCMPGVCMPACAGPTRRALGIELTIALRTE
jgi:hypothetical protein